ncbi:MAG TPA: TonB-dependent receptor [Bryobacteraceae bacterium]|nr:TonB-dependent receptor [Bryobacteraceae bacterium]
MKSRSRQLHSSILLILVTLVTSNILRADVTGSILGIVKDPTQAVIAGARIVATNQQTNFSQETTSAADGSYHILALPVGPYKVTATASGFQQYTTSGIDLKVNDQLKIDILLEVGSIQQEVSVTANAIQVETSTTQLGDVIESKKILALPLNGRSYLDLLGLQAGVVPTTANSIQQDRSVSGGYSSNVGNVSVNGQRETSNAFLVNGGDVSEGRNLGAGLVPNLDSVEEFRLITNSFDAEYGKFSGAVMNAVTKSGTNRIHGTAFEFLRNDKLDANNFFDNQAPPGPDGKAPRAELRRNQFGYAMGGPFWKNKLFWFTDYQGTRQVIAASTGLVQLPTLDQRNGIFSPSDLSGTIDGPYWAQVLTQRLGYGVTNGEPYSFAGCTLTSNCVFPGGTIPQRAFAKPAIGILPFIPVGNIDPNTGLFEDASQKDRIQDDKAGQRVDFVNQKTGNWSWYYHFDDANAFHAIPAASVPGFPSFTPQRAQQIVMSNTKTLGPTAVNEARVSFFRAAVITDKPKGPVANLSDLGFVTGIGSLGINPSGPPGFPSTVPPESFNNFSIGNPTLTTTQPNNTWMFSDSFSKVSGNHTLKFGGEFRYLQINERNVCAPNGDFSFDGSVTGVDIADFLIGAPAYGGFNQCSMQFLDSRTRYGGAYGQDSWKIKPNLTLNLGVRWEVSMPWYDTQGKIETIVPGLQSTQFPTAPNGWVVPGDPGIPSTLAPTHYNNWAPRLGMAYSPGFTDGVLKKIFGGPGKTSIRASFGIYYTSIEDLNLFYEVGDAPFGLYWTTPSSVLFEEPYRTRTDGSSQGVKFPFTFPTPGDPANKTLDYGRYLPIQYSPGYDIHNTMPYAEHYNFSIQRELTKSTVLTLAYVGTQGHKLISQHDADPGNAALCLQLNAIGATDLTTSSTGCGPYAENDIFQLPNGSKIYSTRNYLGSNYCPTSSTLICFSQQNTFTQNSANSNYNSFQASLERKAADMTFLIAYTYSKALDDSSNFNDYMNFTNYRLSRGLSNFDLTHNFVASYNWAIPFDRAFRALPKRLTQGWTVNGISRFTTGFPIQIRQGNGDISLTGSNADQPNRVGPVTILDPRNLDANGGNRYFLADAFQVNDVLGTFGNSSRRFFHGPGIINTDFGVAKRVPITESLALEFRAEFFNIFNHTQFNNPSGNISSSRFGLVSGAHDSRIGQISAKFYW